MLLGILALYLVLVLADISRNLSTLPQPLSPNPLYWKEKE